eukprot:Em0005g309a
MRMQFYKATRHVFSRGALLNQTTWLLVTELESMHYHNQQVPIHYGVCGQGITKYRAKKRECKAFSAELKIAFDIDTSGDDVNIHPEMFCMHLILFGWQKHTDHECKSQLMLKELKCALCSNILSQPLELQCGALKIRGIVSGGEASALIQKEVLILSDDERRSLLDKAGISSSIDSLGQLRWLKSPGICLAGPSRTSTWNEVEVLKEIKCHMEIGDAVTSDKKLDTQVLWTELDLIGWYKPFMPVHEQAAVVSWKLYDVFVRIGRDDPLQQSRCLLSSSGQQEYHIGAGLTWEETKGPPSEQQGQFTALDAAIHFWRHLAHTSAPHCSSSGSFSANDPLLAQIPSQRFEVSSSGQHPHKKSCPVQGCQQLIAPTTWADPPVPLPTFDSDCKLPGCTVQHIPVKDRLAFALALCSALSMEAAITSLCLSIIYAPNGPKVSSVHYGIEHSIIIPLVPTPPLTTNIQQFRQQTLLLREGLLSKACQVLTSLGLALNNNTTWNLLVSMHLEGTPPPQLLPQPCLPPDFDIMALLHSFPKDTACGPSGLRIQHLIEASEVSLQFPICAVLRVVVNLLISSKVPVQVARFLAGGNLVALEKNKPNFPPDIWLIAVGEAIRHLAGKCLCVIPKGKAHDFLAPLQLGVACPAGAEKIIHGLRGCVDEHWHDADFAVLKIDLHNAFNQISRQAVLDACGLHFPELLPWSSWCYNRGPPLGLCINITKCELFSLSELSTFPDEMKRSIVPHFEILGTPIDDLVLCAKFVAQKQSEASTEGDMSYESTEGDMSYESTEGGMSYESTEGDMSYESTEGGMSYESTEGGMSYESTEGGMSYESTEGGMSYESTEGDMSYESTEGGMSYESTEGGMSYESTEGGMSYESTEGGMWFFSPNVLSTPLSSTQGLTGVRGNSSLD